MKEKDEKFINEHGVVEFFYKKGFELEVVLNDYIFLKELAKHILKSRIKIVKYFDECENPRGVVCRYCEHGLGDHDTDCVWRILKDGYGEFNCDDEDNL